MHILLWFKMSLEYISYELEYGLMLDIRSLAHHILTHILSELT